MAIAFNENYEGTTPFSDTCFQLGLNVGVVETYTVPGSSTTRYRVEFSYTSNASVFVALNKVPSIPALPYVGTEPYVSFKPNKKYVKGGDVLQFITSDATAHLGGELMQL